ncbi:hypothetical protein GOD21_12870 [Sinorhizobium medicae]|nr:hypothetical protein [Sinorhizobium medicae]
MQQICMLSPAIAARWRAFAVSWGNVPADAGIRFEQELARLFYRSGWTQEELAAKEGKNQSWVSRQVLFGAFLNFMPMGIKSDSALKTLSERRFRALWQKTGADYSAGYGWKSGPQRPSFER